MKITKETKLSEIIPEKFEYKHITYHTLSENPRITINLNKHPSMDESLEKAKKDYPEGTVFKSVYSNQEAVSDGEFIKTNCRIVTNHYYVYFQDEWAKIIKKPILKINETFLYEGNEYWQVDTDTYKMHSLVIKSHFDYYNENDYDLKRFTTKQSALDFIIEEANRRFKVGSKVNFGYDDSINVIKFIEFGKDIFDENDTIIKINGDRHIWNESKGFIAEPIKEQGFTSKDEDEIEAHKLGFHIGDEVWTNYGNYVGVIDSFYESCGDYYCHCVNCSTCKISKLSIFLKNPKPSKLMLGEYPVIIENGFIHCKDGVVHVTDWIHWHALLKYVKNISIDGSSPQLTLGSYKTNYYTGTKTIKIGCIDNATLKQVKKITKAIKNLHK